MDYKSQALQDVSVRIHSIKDDGTDNTGDAVNLSTIILDPAGNELVGTTDYTEATFSEIGTSGVYECLFPSTAPTKVFTSVDQNNPYTIILISSTADTGGSEKTIRIVSRYIWNLPTVSNIWTHSTRTLTSFGTLVADIWANVTRTLTTAVALETTSQEILAQVTGTGNRVITIHVQDTLSADLQDVLVRIGEASQTTGVSGDAVFALNDGDYDVVLRKNLVSFTVPESLTVSGDGTHPYTGILIVPSAPTQPDTCVVFGTVIDDSGAVVSGAKISIKETNDATFSNTQKLIKSTEITSDSNGFWELEKIRSSELDPDTSPYEAIITYGDTGFRFVTSITVPDADSVEFSTIVNT